MDFKHKTLSNGLTLIAEPNPAAHTAGAGVFVRTGTRDETPGVMGVSHFLEHMCFKGTPTRTSDELNQAFDDRGLENNAYTSHEQTVYYAHGLPEHHLAATELLVDMMRPTLKQDDFDMEKKVILEEIAMYDDRPYWRAQDSLGEQYYQGHPLGYRVLGTAKTVTDLSRDQMQHYFDARYASDQMVIAAAGKIDFEPWCDAIEKQTEGWKPSGAARDFGTLRPAAADLSATDEGLSQQYLCITWPAPSSQSAQRFAAHVYAELIGDVDGSRLYWALIDSGLAEEAALSFNPLDQTGQLMGYCAADPRKGKQVEQILKDTLANAAENLSEDELTRTKMKLATLKALESERPSGRMHRLGDRWLATGQPPEDEAAAIAAVTIEDIQQIAAYYHQGPVATVRLGPGASEEK